MQTPWGTIEVVDAHVHFFSHGFFQLLAKQKEGLTLEHIGTTLGWEMPPADPRELAQRWAGEGKSVLLGAADTFRAAAIEQLQVWATRAGATVVAHAPGADPGAVVFDALLVLQEDEGGTAVPETDDLGADLALLLRETARGLVDPRFDEPYRVLVTEIQHDPALARELLDRVARFTA